MLRLILFVLGCTTLANAQNSDLGVQFGYYGSRIEINSGSNRIVQRNYGLTWQFNYAYQLMEHGPRRLYLEFPLVPMGGSTRITAGAVVVRRSRVFLTPGLRFQYALTPRATVYVAGGAGLGWYSEAVVSNNPAIVETGTRTAAAWNAGAGFDWRLSRLLSFRTEYRNFGLPSVRGGNHNSPNISAGLALHF